MHVHDSSLPGFKLTKPNRSGDQASYYRLDVPPGLKPLKPSRNGKHEPVEPAELKARHAAYTALCEVLGLSAEHHAALVARGLSEADIVAGKFCTLPVDHRGDFALGVLKLLKVDGIKASDLLRVPGFIKRPNVPLTVDGRAGLLIPVMDATGTIGGMVLRPDNPPLDPKGKPIGKYVWFTSSIRGGPGAVCSAHVPPGVTMPVELVRLTEGPLKAHIATIKSDLPTIGLPGVASWPLALPALKSLTARVVRLAVDMDASVKSTVAGALANACRGLVAAGYEVQVERWPAEHKGIDDALVAGVVPELLDGLDAARHALDQVRRLGGLAHVELDQVVAWVRWYLDRDEPKALFADTELLDGMTRLRDRDPIDFSTVVTLLRKRKLWTAYDRWSKSKNVEQKKAPAPAAPATQRPEIEITTQRHEVTRQAIAALARDQRLYLRGEAFATAYRCPDSDEKLFGGVAVRNANGAPRIKLLSEPAAGCFLTENATFYKMVNMSGEAMPRDCHPPDWLVRSVLAWHERPGFRSLLSVAECPYVGRDGSIVSEPGYDPATGTLLSPAFKLGPIPDKITEDHVTEAFGRLNYLVHEFPFEDGFSVSVWLAALFTAIQRPMIAGSVPGFAFIGNKAGCGKGLLVDVIGRLVFGGPVPAFQYPEDRTESEKVMVSLALGGVQAVHFDNLSEGQFYGNSSIDSALTCLVKGGRLLGGNQDANIPLRSWWTLSGNNLSPGKDAYRRWLPCNLVTALDRPHERTDVSSDELRAYVTEHRSKIITDALTILVAHARAGRPSHGLGRLGSFEEWDDIVRTAVHFATGNDCLTTQRKASDDSPDRLAKLALLEAWHDELPGQDKQGYTVNEACALVNDKPALYPRMLDVLQSRGQKGKPIEPTKLGYVIRAMKNTNTGGIKFVDTGVKRNNAVAWSVTKA
jgi:putative DNA primase/helicase